ncbi:Hypothetical protein CINCED_3A002327 [Cinara cedri]|uniref:Uncharacterized protein n=1 Tax=Cinara cedri TaxID=506608 RepID=A0A5E4NS98_9HEMI|nr:Hypothetical protein CINCED_3A002327 [Cinara cedri]
MYGPTNNKRDCKTENSCFLHALVNISVKTQHGRVSVPEPFVTTAGPVDDRHERGPRRFLSRGTLSRRNAYGTGVRAPVLRRFRRVPDGPRERDRRRGQDPAGGGRGLVAIHVRARVDRRPDHSGTQWRIARPPAGKWFTRVFVAEYRPEVPLTYVIVASGTRQIFATDFAAGDCRADTGAGLNAKKQVRFAPNIATYYEPLPDTIADNARPGTAAENLLLGILNRILPHIPPPKIETSRKPSSPSTASGNLHPGLAEKKKPTS